MQEYFRGVPKDVLPEGVKSWDDGLYLDAEALGDLLGVYQVLAGKMVEYQTRKLSDLKHFVEFAGHVG
jgi:hypothetical protein